MAGAFPNAKELAGPARLIQRNRPNPADLFRCRYVVNWGILDAPVKAPASSAGAGVFFLARFQQLRQLGDACCDLPRLILGHETR
jgi:hypothetical protein